jgi:hypothetical protein
LGRALGFPLSYSALPPDVFERALIPTFGETVAQGIAKTYVWLAEHHDTTLFTSTDSELRRAFRARSRESKPGRVINLGRSARQPPSTPVRSELLNTSSPRP